MATLRELTRRDGVRRRPRTAFVLSGGGNLGSIQVGMLKALAEREVVPDVVLGCSVGALNGAGYALDPSAAGVRRLEEHWRNSTSHTLMPSSRIPSAVQLLRKGFSLHSPDGLRSSLESLLGAAPTFDDLQLPFQCVAAEVEAAVEKWFDDGDLIQAILASAALPAVYPPVVIDGVRYVDGGVIDNVPIARAVELGCRTIYVLHVGAHGRPDAEIRRPLDGALLAYWIARNSRFARDLASLPPRVEAIVLPPGQRPDIKYDDFSQTDELVAQGYQNSARFLDDRASLAGERRRGADLLAPFERLVLSARSRSVRQAQEAAVSPDGAIVTGGDAEPDENADADADADVIAEVRDPGALRPKGPQEAGDPTIGR
jgi:NTE family protein